MPKWLTITRNLTRPAHKVLHNAAALESFQLEKNHFDKKQMDEILQIIQMVRNLQKNDTYESYDTIFLKFWAIK